MPEEKKRMYVVQFFEDMIEMYTSVFVNVLGFDR